MLYLRQAELAEPGDVSENVCASWSASGRPSIQPEGARGCRQHRFRCQPGEAEPNVGLRVQITGFVLRSAHRVVGRRAVIGQSDVAAQRCLSLLGFDCPGD